MIGKIKKIANKLIKKSYWYNNIMFADCSKFWNEQEFGLEVVNLGSTSACYAFNYDGLGMKARNWAMAPQSFVGDLEILRNYSCFLKEGASVIIPICPFSCLGGFNLDLPDKYYTILNIASIPRASYTRKQNIMSIMQNPISAFPLIHLFSCRKQERCVDFERDALNRMKSWKHEFSIINWEYPLTLINQDAYNDSTRILSEILVYCFAHQYKPVIVLPPMSKELSSKFTRHMRRLFIKDFVERVDPSVKFLDYMDCSVFENKKLFSNSFMLNVEGAKLFTSKVLKDIRG